MKTYQVTLTEEQLNKLKDRAIERTRHHFDMAQCTTTAERVREHTEDCAQKIPLEYLV